MSSLSNDLKGTRRPIGRRLTFRFGMALGVGAACILIGAAFWNLRLQRSHLTQLLQTEGEQTAEIIRSSTREAMLRDCPEDVRRIVETIAAQPGIALIRVFDKQGRVRISSRAEESGTLVDKDAEQCYACHARDKPLDRLDQADRTRFFQNADGSRVLAVIAPIHNEAECSNAACHAHSASQQVLGVLDAQLSLDSVDKALAASERQLILGVGTTALAVLALAVLLTWLMVLRPVRRLTRAASRVAAGDMLAPVQTSSRDEIGEMTEAWNAMVGEVARAHAELEEWGRSLEKRVDQKSRELEKAHQQILLVEKMASLGKLAAVVAHEINNPLTGIGTYARLLRKRLSARGEAPAAQGDDTDRILKMIEEEAARCGTSVKNLLLFSRTPRARLDDQSLGPILERCTMLLKHQAQLQGVTLRMDAGEVPPHLTCDASQIQQVVLALTLNALEATPQGGKVTIFAREDSSRDQVVLKISDTGRGIPNEHLHKIFEPFFTTKEEGSGVGLGLAIVFGIVNKHHGTIDVDSKPGAGTAFTVRLPRRQPVEATASQPGEEIVTP